MKITLHNKYKKILTLGDCFMGVEEAIEIYKNVNLATEKLEQGENLSKEEIKSILVVINELIGHSVPSTRELEDYESNRVLLQKTNKLIHTKEHFDILTKIVDFEEKYL